MDINTLEARLEHLEELKDDHEFRLEHLIRQVEGLDDLMDSLIEHFNLTKVQATPARYKVGGVG